MTKQLLLLIALMSNLFLFAQEIELIGKVYDEYLEPFPNALVKASNGKTTTTSYDGRFKIKVKLPITIEVKYIGYSAEAVKVVTPNDQISLILKENSGLDQVVLSASRTPERLFESQASVERISLNDIRRTSSTSFYESLENLKNVDLKTNSFLLKSLNTRGFSPIENTRVVQLIDGVDNVLPSATMSTGNMTGLVDMDVENVEVLSGAASALYGANAFNGVILIKSKNPFDYSGISVKLQSGVTSQKSGNTPFYNPSLRMAYKFSDYFAGKVSFSYASGDEWHDNDYRNIRNGKIEEGKTNFAYNGVNTYGDETKFNPKALTFVSYLQKLREAAEAKEKGNLIEAQQLLQYANNILQKYVSMEPYDVSRTGYDQDDFTDNKYKNIKFNASLNYRPLGNEKLEISLTSRFSNTKSLFTYGANKFSIDDGQFDQHILNIKGEDFFVRGYTSQVDLGDSYSLQALPILVNETYNPSTPKYDQSGNLVKSGWVFDYIGVLQNGGSYQEARLFADKKRFLPGSPHFVKALKDIKSRPLSQGGAKFEDYTAIYQVEGDFNFERYIDWLGIKIGGVYRKYFLDMPGTLNSPGDIIQTYDYGVYTQFRKSIVDERLNFIASLRYDKSKNFDGQYSPRTSVSYIAGEDRNHIFRASVQTAFRMPTIQQQYSSVARGRNSYTIGNTEDNLDNHFDAVIGEEKRQVTKEFLWNTYGFTAPSFDEFYDAFLSETKAGDGFEEAVSSAITHFDKLKSKKIQSGLKAESLTSIELGYRGMLSLTPTNVLEIDFSGYYNMYDDFISYEDIYIPYNKEANADPALKDSVVETDDPLEFDPYGLAVLSVIANERLIASMPINNSNDISSYGLGISFRTKVFNNYKVGVNYSWNDFTYENTNSFEPQFNTSKHNIKVLLENDNIFKNIGANLAVRWQDGYKWVSTFASGEIKGRTVLDGHLSYALPKLKSRFKAGGVNLLGKPYFDNIGTSRVGSMYYFTWIIND